MLQPKNLAIRKNTIRPPFTRTSVRMTTNRESTPPVSRVSTLPARRVSVVTVRNAQRARSVKDAAARRVAGSVMTSARRVVPVRTSPSV